MKEITLVTGLAAIAGLILYFVPTIIAGIRGHMDQLAIFALNLLLGWTALGWIIAFIWSLTGNVRDSSIAYSGRYADDDLPRARRDPFQM